MIQNFKLIVKEKNLHERQFLIYNGKLKVEDHHTKSIEIKISYIQQHNKEYMVLNIRDTTQRDLLVTLEDNNKYKDQLLASVSHELRAPLNGNINLVESAIQNTSVPANVKERLLTPALRSSKFLLHLINDILDMSQIKAQKLRLIFKPGKLQETLNDTLQLVGLQAKKKGLELCLVLAPDIHQNICTDHVRLNQIVRNLLNNAIKFTQKGSVTLFARPLPDDSACIKISVQDSGIGMTKGDAKKLFSEYTHIEFADRASINPTGVGLGLSIAYNHAKLLGHQGNKGIVVESAPNIGSTFSFFVESKEEQIEPKDLCAKTCSDKSRRAADELQETEPKISLRISRCFSTNSLLQLNERLLSLADAEGSKCSCVKVLVVDDNPFNIMAFETVLGSLHLECDSVFDGQTAIDKILQRQNTHCGENCKPYSVVFMDQEMPGLTGSETVVEIKRLQAQGLMPPMKIVGCAAHSSVEEVGKFMKSGIDLCL